MKHYGDITKIDGHTVPIVDIIVGGSPCQDLSVAGKREGLAGQRSGLFMDQIRVIKEMHDECRRADVDIRPRYMVWENVPGAFSSNGGADFQAVLEETAKVAERDACIPRLEKWPPSGCIMGDGWSIAWRVHDAQFWGVPQRRKRISLVADFRGGGAPEILFERKSLSRDSEESGETRKESAGDSADSIGEASKCVVQGVDAYNQTTTGDVTMSVTGAATDPHHIPCVIEGNGSRPSHKGDGYAELETMYTLNSTEHHAVSYQKTTGSLMASGYQKNGTQEAANDMYVVEPKTYAMQAIGEYKDSEKASSIKQRDYKDCTDLVVGSFYPQRKAESQCYREDGISNTLTNGTNPGYQNGVCTAIDRASFNQGENAQFDFSVQEDVAQTIVSKGPGVVLTRQLEHYTQETTKE